MKKYYFILLIMLLNINISAERVDEFPNIDTIIDNSELILWQIGKCYNVTVESLQGKIVSATLESLYESGNDLIVTIDYHIIEEIQKQLSELHKLQKENKINNFIIIVLLLGIFALICIFYYTR